MNDTRVAWLPPDGDIRLVRFQQDAAVLAGLPEGAPGPAYLELPGRLPQGLLLCGDWLLFEGEPVLEARDERGPVGFFRLGLGLDRAWTPADLTRLPAAPGWQWRRGVIADLAWEHPAGDASFVLWSWSNRRGWKADPPRA